MTPEQVQVFKAMSPADKLSLAADFYFASRHLKSQGLRAQHPEWPEEKIRQRVKELFLYATS